MTSRASVGKRLLIRAAMVPWRDSGSRDQNGMSVSPLNLSKFPAVAVQMHSGWEVTKSRPGCGAEPHVVSSLRDIFYRSKSWRVTGACNTR